MSPQHQDLPVIQRTYDLILWLVPRLNKLPRNYKHVLGDRIQGTLYGVLDGLLRARFSSEKVKLLEGINAELDVLRYQLRLCKDLELLDLRRYEFAGEMVTTIGQNLGGWIRQQRRATT